MDLSLLGLRILQEVAASGSFTAAADALGYTQSAISRQIAALEREADAPLFIRRARGVELTPAGALLARHAAIIRAAVEAADHELAGLHDRLAGRLTIGAFPTAAAVLVPRALARLGREHPGLHVLLAEGSTPAQLSALRAGRLEVAVIGVGSGLPAYDLRGLRQDPVFDGALQLAVSTQHRFARSSVVPVAELTGEKWIVGEGARMGDPQFGAWPTLVQPRIAYAVRGWPTRLGMVAADLGVSVIPQLAAASVPTGVRVVPVEDQGWPGRTTLAVTSASRSPATDAVVVALRAEGAAMKESR